MSELTEKEAAVLFNQTSKALQDDDSAKLSELMEMKASDEEAPVESETPAEVEPENTEDKDNEEVPKETELEPSDKTAEVEPKEKTELTELEKLKEQLEKVSRENHSLRSQAGRVPHVQRKIQELDKKLAELAQAKATPSSQPSAKIQPKIKELLKGVSDTDSDLADAIAAAIAEATDGIAEDMLTKQESTLSLLRQQELQTYQEQEANRLLEMYPNAVEIFPSQHWKSWKQEQSARVVALAESDNADDVAFALEKYAKDMLSKYPELASNTVDKTAEASTTIVAEPSDKAKQIEAERARKKVTAVTVGSASAQGKVEQPSDLNALFNKYSEQIRKERTG